MAPTRDVASIYAGLLFAVAGAAALWLNREAGLGTAARMGPGFFPGLLGCCLIGLGALIGLRGARAGGPAEHPVGATPGELLRPVILLATLAVTSSLLTLLPGVEPRTALGAGTLVASVAAFALGLRAMALVLGPVAFIGLHLDHLGLVGASILLVLASGFASRGARWRELAALALGVTLFTYLVFAVGLGLGVPLWPTLAMTS